MQNQDFKNQNLFFSNAVHEIRTPIQTILGTLELLSETKLSTEQKDYIQQLKLSSEILLTHVNDILDFEKISAKKIELENIAFNPILVVEDAINLESVEASNKKIELFSEIDYSLYCDFLGDANRIRQILINLIKNAVKFTSKGFVKVSLSKNNENLRFCVIDSGCGISDEKKQKLFSAFSQSDLSVTREHGGTGLGLLICKNLVSLMNGTIGVLDNDFGGSTFYFELPLKMLKKSENPYKCNFNSSSKILIVENSLELAQNLKERLEFLGFSQIFISTDFEKGLEFIKNQNEKNQPFEYVFINSVLGEKSGSDFASQVRNFLGLKNIKLILTIYKNSIAGEEKIKILNWFNGFLFKPLTLKNICNLLSELQTSKKTSSLNQILSESISENNFSQSSFEALGMKILVAEDHPVNRRLLKTFLLQFGATVFEAEDGTEAIEITKKNPDLCLIFMDNQMQTLGGIEAAEKIRNFNQNVIIILCSANAKETLIENPNISINDFLQKPFKKEDVKKIIQKWKSVIFLPELTESDEPKEDEIWSIKDFEDTISNEKFLGSQILFDFQDQTQSFINEAKIAIQKNDFDSLRKISHTLEGSSSAISATKLKEIASELNAAAKQKNVNLLEKTLKTFEETYKIFSKKADDWKSSIF